MTEAPADLRTDDFDFDLPPDLIAQTPAEPRERARLLVVNEAFGDRRVSDLPELLLPGDLMVVNDTRVIPAQLSARRGAAHIGITLDRALSDGIWHVLVRNARRLRVGDTIDIEGCEAFSATVEELEEGGAAILRFNVTGEDFRARLNEAGALALPPYIRRPHGPTARDAEDYQTIFATREGAVAAPTAGLHLTPSLMEQLHARGVRTVRVTLHVGAGTFLPVREADLSRHRMHAEWGEVTPETADAVNAARAAGERIVAVGTTSLRLLESAADEAGTIRPFRGETSVFIHPGVAVRSADLLLTNFHLPRSTLFMLVCAFAGSERMRAAYAHAIAERYRFFSYGDATLLSRA